jgi:uncharacterized membrane protein
MSLYDWLLFLHVLAAFAVLAAVTLYSYLVVLGFSAAGPAEVARQFRLMRTGDVLMAAGAGGTLVFGIWLAIQVDGYALWDGWIIAALVLWAAAGAVGDRTSRHYAGARKRADELLAAGRSESSAELREILRSRRGVGLHVVSTLLILLLLIDMIWKPGA